MVYDVSTPSQMNRVFNFSAGPATLPVEVLEEVRAELLDWHHLGKSVMEISHRSKDFIALTEEIERDFRDLLNVPSDYHVLFLQGGGRGQFASVPLNLMGERGQADYFCTGIWSELAIMEAQKYGEVNIVASSQDQHYHTIPDAAQWQFNPNAAYVHLVDNETVNGVEFPRIPDVGAVPLVADMSSNLLSRELDITRFGVCYAGAQKNIGPSGMAIVVVRDDLLGQALPITPSILDYTHQAKARSMVNTPPTFAWYMAGKMFKWLQRHGGLAAMTARNQQKSEALYAAIDGSDFYLNHIDPRYRSRMNVVFHLADESKTADFVEQAERAGLSALKGHRRVGGLRASLYNAMPMEGVQALIEFMSEFERQV